MQLKKALSDSPSAEKYVEQIDLSIDYALKELRSLTYSLHPQSLFDEGLKTTIERFAEGFAVRTSLAVEISISPAADHLSREKQHSLLRIVQEALANVYRHAKATRVDITLIARKQMLQLEIRDDGHGMMAPISVRHRCAPVLGTGLRSMQSRLHEMGGRLKILSAPTGVRRGTILRATIPDAFAIKQNGHACAQEEPLTAGLVTHLAFPGKRSKRDSREANPHS
jgi:signal transduction histidine kinase